MIGHRSEKWWWPVFHFCLDLSVNKAYQLYGQQKRSEEECKLIYWDFGEVLLIHIIDVFENQQQQISSPCKKVAKVSDEVRYDAINHWMGKGKQRRCASCQKTTLYFCEKCNVGLHPDCHKQFHIKK